MKLMHWLRRLFVKPPAYDLAAFLPPELCWRTEGRLGADWRFSTDDRPHFRNGQRCVIFAENKQWEAYLGHRMLGRVPTLTQALRMFAE